MFRARRMTRYSLKHLEKPLRIVKLYTLCKGSRTNVILYRYRTAPCMHRNPSLICMLIANDTNITADHIQVLIRLKIHLANRHLNNLYRWLQANKQSRKYMLINWLQSSNKQFFLEDTALSV